ncbi:MAG: hypothetical protein WBA39_34715 [Rivularia sp. (in: cyanobacteria)]
MTTIKLQTTATPPTLQIERLADLMKSQSGLTLIGCFIAIAIFNFLSGSNHKGKVATSYWGGKREKQKAKRKAKKQIAKPIRNSVALYVGTPPDIRSQIEKQWREKGLMKNKPAFSQQLHKWKEPDKTLYFPDALHRNFCYWCSRFW